MDAKMASGKRPHSDMDAVAQNVTNKRAFIEEVETKKEVEATVEPAASEEEQRPCLLGFSDEILLEIFKNLDGPSLESLSSTCHRLHNIVEDDSLWLEFDYAARPMDAQQLKQRLGRLLPKTRAFRVCGRAKSYPAPSFNKPVVTKAMFKAVESSCPNLRELVLQWTFVESSSMTVADFPASLRHLTLRGVHLQCIQHIRIFFANINTHLPHLQSVCFDNCSWFHTHNLIALSKLESLHHLSLRGCTGMRDCVPYGSVATRFGFKALRTLDLRETSMADSDLQCFNILRSLRVLYVSHPEYRAGRRVAVKSLNGSRNGNGSGLEDAQAKDASAVNDREVCGNGAVAGPSADAVAGPSADALASGPSSDGPSAAAAAPTVSAGPSADAVAGPSAAALASMPSSDDPTAAAAVLSGPSSDAVAGPSAAALASGSSADEPTAAAAAVSSRPSADAVAGSSSDTSDGRASANGESSDAGAVPAAPPPAPAAAGPAADVPPAPRFIQIAQFAPIAADEEPDIAAPNPHFPQLELPAQVQAVIQNHIADMPVIPPVIYINLAHQLQADIPNLLPPSPEVRNYIVVRGSVDAAGPRVLYGSYQNPAGFGAIQEPSKQSDGITDRGICAFGESEANRRCGLVWIRCEQRPRDTLLERLLLNGYPNVTDRTLRHLAESARQLRHLDLRGTGVTEAGVRWFRAERPECVLLVDDFHDGDGDGDGDGDATGDRTA